MIGVLRGTALGLLALGAAAAASAQSDACLAALAGAEARYFEGTLDAADAGLDACLDGTDAAVPALRLMALAHLRRGQITDAKLALLRLLSIRPDYRSSPVQDPPTYVALVISVRRQLDEAAEAAVAAALLARGPWERVPPQPPHLLGLTGPTPAPSPVVQAPPLDRRRPPPSLPLAVSVWGGVTSYGGERGVNAQTAVEEFTENAGPAGGLAVEMHVASRIAVFAAVEAGRYPTLTTRKGPHPSFDEVGSFSAWLQFVTVGTRATAVRWGPIVLAVSAGGGFALGRRDGSIQAAGVVTGGAGVEAAVSPSNRLFFDVYGALTVPDHAIDGAAHPSGPTDIFSGLRLGVRSRFR